MTGPPEGETTQLTQHFTHYWRQRTVRQTVEQGHESLDHLASNLFRRCRVQDGDRVYAINLLEGKLFLLGGLTVKEVVDQDVAEGRLGRRAWDAQDHLLAVPGSETPFRRRELPRELVAKLKFQRGDREFAPRFREDGRPDGQTFRGVRRLSADSAEALEEHLREVG